MPDFIPRLTPVPYTTEVFETDVTLATEVTGVTNDGTYVPVQLRRAVLIDADTYDWLLERVGHFPDYAHFSLWLSQLVTGAVSAALDEACRLDQSGSEPAA